ncbi:uncharacterized protein LOC131632725 [Vicia villosa]|uniref:uncharacterized protein LOC131632725 n=1 Tax=Vicia villosa TaxID=3911 RepID=UPI00273CC184|nr:uncharacterized protein LOC131632725 [Vicia villosa]
MTECFVETQNAILTHFEEQQESHNFNFEASMEDSYEALTHSRLEYMMEHFVETQTVQNEDLRKQSLQINESLRQLITVVESLLTHNEAVASQISMLEQKYLGPFLEEHVDIVTTSSEQQSESPKESHYEFDESDEEFDESNIEIEESFGEKRVMTKEDPPTPSKREDVEEIEKEAPIVVPPPYTPPIPFLKSFMEATINCVKRAFDKKVRPRRFKEGNLVLKKILTLQPDLRGKWTPNYEGPYVVKNAFSGGALTLTTMDSEEFPCPVNTDMVKKYFA